MPVNWSKPVLRDSFFIGMLALLGFALLRDTRTVAAAVSQGLTLCIQVLLPSLFPFFVLSNLLILSGAAEKLAPLFHRFMKRFFNLPGSCAPVLLLGAVGGYPVGAKTISALYQQRLCTREEALRALRFCNNAGPAFLIGSIGGGLLNDTRLGVRLYLTHLLAAILVGLLGKKSGPIHTVKQVNCSSKSRAQTSFVSNFLQAVTQSFDAFGNVCAFVIFFAVLMGILQKNMLFSALCNLLPGAKNLWSGMLCGMLEVTSGASQLAAANLPGKILLPAFSFLCGWGGLSVQCQSICLIQQADLPCRTYLQNKLLQGLLAAGLTLFICW